MAPKKNQKKSKKNKKNKIFKEEISDRKRLEKLGIYQNNKSEDEEEQDESWRDFG